MEENTLNHKIRNWWNKYPYSYGLSENKNDKGQNVYCDVGDIDDGQLNEKFFIPYMKKCRKFFDDAQEPDQRLAARFLNYDALRNKEVLDIAIGYGWSTVELADAGALVTGIDVTPRAIEVTKKHLAIRKLKADLYVMDSQNMEFENGSFDYVHAWGCLMHMPNTQQAINETFRVLKPGGRISGYMYNKNSITMWWNYFFLQGVIKGKLISCRGDIQKLASRCSDGATIGGCPLAKVYTPKEIENKLQKAGYENIKVNPWGPPAMLDNFPTRKYRFGKYLPRSWKTKIANKYGWGVIFNATKPS